MVLQDCKLWERKREKMFQRISLRYSFVTLVKLAVYQSVLGSTGKKEKFKCKKLFAMDNA